VHFTRRQPARDDGFTLVEMVVALLIISISFTSLAYVLFAGMRAVGAARQRSGVTAIANAEMERLRSLPYGSVGVSSTDENRSRVYPDGEHDGRQAVVIDAASPDGARALEAFQANVAPNPPVPGLAKYDITRRITWEAEPREDGDPEKFKRLEIQIDWVENQMVAKSLTLKSVLYPGNLGPSPYATNQPPTGNLSFTPAAPATGQLVTFTASGSDPDGHSLQYQWDFGDGGTSPKSPTRTVTHTFTAAGWWTVAMRITDGFGGATIVNQVLFVSGARTWTPPNQARIETTPDLVGSATPKSTPTPGFITMQFEGEAYRDGVVYTEPGVQLRFEWTFQNVTTATAATVGTATGPVVSHTFPATATDQLYRATLVVRDAAGAVATTSLDLRVPLNPTLVACRIRSAVFQQSNNPNGTNHVLVENNAKPPSTRRVFTFTIRTEESGAGCGSMEARIPIRGGHVGGALTAGSLVSGQRTWSGTYEMRSEDRFDLGDGASRSWDVWAPIATREYNLTPSFVVVVQ
jgi:prepilin-type N-terminal cleavage/methylation domain-containing protein